jgi:hypothetical protein
MLDGFNILKQYSDGGIAWIQTTKNLDAARERIKFLAASAPGEYVVLCQITQKVVAREISRCQPAGTNQIGILPVPEGRRFNRIRLKPSGSLILSLDGEHQRRFPCLILDSSQGGFRLRVGLKLRRGQVVEVVAKNAPFTSVACRVIWVGGRGSGHEEEVGLQDV